MNQSLLSNANSRIKAFILVFFIFILAYFPIITWMWDRWFVADSYYSHGILIPFISLYLIWQKRYELHNIQIKSSRFGLILIFLGTFLFLAASCFRVYFLSGIAMLLTLCGIINYFFGVQFLKIIWFPLVFLLFMIPMPLITITNISFQMKIIAAQISTTILNSMGITAIREGSYIYMKHAYVIVDDVCSGLRSLISLTALGALFSHLINTVNWKKWILFLSSIPIAIITNVIRIVFLSLVSEVWGPEKTIGFVHDISGYLVFLIAFILLLAVRRLLE